MMREWLVLPDVGTLTPDQVFAAGALTVVLVIRWVKPAETVDKAEAPPSDLAAEAIDPICGMSVTIAGARHRSEAGGRTTYFCCAHCQETFEQNPARYLVSGA